MEIYGIIIQQSFYSALAVFTSFCIFFGIILSYASISLKVKVVSAVEKIDSLLPQTQCGQCGYPGCRPYADAIADGDAINKCPPGGQITINAIANFLDISPPSLDNEYGFSTDIKTVAFIREDECIGCTKCIQACPVDAILGAAKQMHTVIEKECTGCDLCVDPCPVDCIDMVSIEKNLSGYRWDQPQSIINSDKARDRFEYQIERKDIELASKRVIHDRRLAASKNDQMPSIANDLIKEAMKQIEAKKSSPEADHARFLRRVARARDQLHVAEKKLKELKIAVNDDKYKRALASVESARVRLAVAQSSDPSELKPNELFEKNKVTLKRTNT
jgi:electron transport complex protein RnfB